MELSQNFMPSFLQGEHPSKQRWRRMVAPWHWFSELEAQDACPLEKASYLSSSSWNYFERRMTICAAFSCSMRIYMPGSQNNNILQIPETMAPKVGGNWQDGVQYVRWSPGDEAERTHGRSVLTSHQCM